MKILPPIPKSAPTSDPSLLAARLPSGTVFLLMLAFGLVDAAEARIPRGDPIVNQDENLLVNGNFQSKDGRLHPLRWKYASKKIGPGLNAIVSRDQKMESDMVKSSPTNPPPTDPPAASLKIIDESGSDDVTIRSEKRLAAPGLVYDAAARVYQGAGGAELVLEFWNADNQLIVEFPSGTAFANAPDDRSAWKLASVTGAAPPTALHVTVAIRSSAGNTGTGYWDNASLVINDEYEPGLVTGQHELLIDNYRLESSYDVERVVIPPVKSPPLVVKNKSWESDILTVATVLKDPGPLYDWVMWYYSNGRMLQATSDDGITWEKPATSPYFIGSSDQNNISFPPGKGRITVVYDPPSIEPNQARRFKALAHAGPNTGYFYWYSGNGKEWTAHSETVPVLPYGNISNLARGPGKKYIAITRQRTVNADTGATFTGDRMAFVSTGTNMVDWVAPEFTGTSTKFAPAVESDQADDFAAQSRRHIECQVESMPVYPYQGIYIGFPTIFELTDFSTGINAAGGNGPSYPQIASSRDLKVWHRPNRSPIIPLSRKGGWDAGAITVASSMVEDGDNFHVYYSGENLGRGGTIPDVKTAKGSIARATWQRDRFVAFRNAANRTSRDENNNIIIDPKLEGFLRTKVVTFTLGSKLKINAKVGLRGSIRVTVLDENNVEKPGFTYAAATGIPEGDYTNLEVPLSGNFPALANTPIKLKFYLRNAELYSFWIDL